MKVLLSLLALNIIFVNSFCQELLTNGNFTSNGVAWTTTGDFTYNTTFSQYNFEIGYAYTSEDPNHTGTLEQQFTIPSNATNVTLSFYTKITSDEQTSSQIFDFCTVNLFTVGGGNSHQFVMLSNLDENNAYQQMNFTIPSSFYGDDVRLVLIFANDGATPTRFRFDNVSVQATTSGSGGGGSNDQDFYVYDQSINTSSVNAGNSVNVNCRQAYQGTSINGTENVYLGYFLSTDPILGSNDYFFPITNEYSTIGNSDLDDPESATLDIPSSTPSGQYYVIFKADNTDLFQETNEQNNTVSIPLYINGNFPPPPVIDIVSPNTYMCLPSITPISITTSISGLITGKKLEYSLDGGITWNLIDEVQNTSNTVFNPSWITPNITDVEYCKLKLTVSSVSGDIIDISDDEFVIIPSAQIAEFNPNGTSHLFNPFSTQHWAFDGWVNGTYFAYSGSHYGENAHQCVDYYAKDFAKLNGNFWYSATETCNKDFNSPLNGTIIHITNIHSPYCEDQSVQSPSYGNQIVIRSTANSEFAFRVAHLNEINPNLSIGDFVSVGDSLVNVGSPDVSGAHAHCVLYKNITQIALGSGIPFDQFLENGLTVTGGPSCNDYKNTFAAEFRLDANPSSGGGSLGLIEEFDEVNYVVYPIPSRENIMLTSEAIISHESIEIFDLTGKTVECKKEKIHDHLFSLSEIPSGIYLLNFMINGTLITERIVIH